MPTQPIDDRNVVLLQPLRSPRGLKADLPLTPRATPGCPSPSSDP